MKRPFLNAKYYETYYFATCIRNILCDQFAYIRQLNDFYGDYAYLTSASPFKRYSAFHSFIEFILGNLLTKDTDECDIGDRQLQMIKFADVPSAVRDMKPHMLPIEHALHFHGLSHISFIDWLAESGRTFAEAHGDDPCDYLDALREEGVIDALLGQAVRETFFVLFANRQLLLLFNQMMSSELRTTEIADIDPETARLFERDGVLRRVTIPDWVKRAVYYRDRGLCSVCANDLSGLLNIWSEDQFDHVVPLAAGGLNDVTNIQLLCGNCNRRKSDGEAITSSRYEDWYELDL